jgi:hypothetical protein
MPSKSRENDVKSGVKVINEVEDIKTKVPKWENPINPCEA